MTCPSVPAFGGCRFRPYSDTEAAVADARRLAEGMSLKNALAGIPFGGGKAVIIQPRGAFERGALFEAFGRAVEELGGLYVTAMDSGTETTDMDAIGRATGYVSGRSGAEGDLSPSTALGLFRHWRPRSTAFWGADRHEGLRVAIQGTGHVGAALADRLADAGARLLLSDAVPARVEKVAQRTGGRILEIDAILAAPCDVLAPCGLGGSLDPETVERLDCRLVAGAANNQLATPDAGEQLARRRITYVPDFLLNAGGVIHAALAWQGKDADHIRRRVEAIGATTRSVLEEASTGTCCRSGSPWQARASSPGALRNSRQRTRLSHFRPTPRF
ncbi:MAG: Glu/Leu/Phe/Val dehydrogenase dimerization domain-containing protein [Gammaproteobacteria bacterium]|nr:Glu/Leu/Phe/Val dehydrogenase dimerization domain-containing protein [Gammaproteobacteria bacterium]